MRLLNEPYLTRKAMERVSREWLEDMLRRLETCPEQMELRERNTYFQKLDTELHTTILSYADNVFLRNGLQNAYDHDRRIRICRHKALGHPDHIDISRQEHICIVKAMLGGDGELVEKLCREHVAHSRDMLYEAMYEIPMGRI